MDIKNNNLNSLFKLLAIGNLLEPLSQVQAEVRYVTECKIKKSDLEIKDHDAISGLMKELNIKDRKELALWQKTNLLSDNPENLLEYARFLFKRRCIVNKLIEGNGEALFLRYKDRLDRVLYSFLRVENQDLAYHLYYQIESGEIDFGEAATKYSDGPESKTQGIIGPCDLTVPHPDISSRLRTASPRQLFKPFLIDKWVAILRLEYRFDSEFNENTKNILGKLILGSKIKPISSQIYKDSITSFVD